MPAWPDKDEVLLNEYIRQLPPPTKQQAYRRVIRWFQIFVSHNSTFDQEAVQAWIRARSAQTCVQTALVNAQWIDRFLDWLVTRKAVAVNPFAELRRRFGCRLTAPIARALLGSSPTETLEALRPLPRMAATWDRPCVTMSHACARSASDTAMNIGSCSSIAFCNSVLAHKTSRFQRWCASTLPMRRRRQVKRSAFTSEGFWRRLLPELELPSSYRSWTVS